MTLWIAIVCVALVTFGLRASFIVFADPARFPEFFRRALAYVPPSVLAAIVVPGLLAPQGVVDASLSNPRWIAGLAAIAVAARSRSYAAAVLTGMGVLWLAQWVW